MKTTGNQNPTSNKEVTRKETAKTNSGTASGLKELFESGLRDIYWSEKALLTAIPKMAKNTNSPELMDVLNIHIEETKEQVVRLERIFEIINRKAIAKICNPMDGLIKEGERILQEIESGVVRDAGIIAACQKIEHYEIATYGSLRQIAETLGLPEAVTLFEKSFNEEKRADQRLTEVALNTVNIEAAE